MNGKVFASQAIRDLYVLEVFAVFAGAARLTKTFGRQGFKALAFDKTSKRSEGQSVSKCRKVSQSVLEHDLPVWTKSRSQRRSQFHL